MDVILLKNISTLGDKHDVISVKNGYGRNFLIPKGLAVIANKSNMTKLDELVAKEKAEEDQRIEEYKEMAEQMSGKTLKIGVKSGTSGKIFGSITNIQIARAINEQLALEIPRKKIVVDEEIKMIGSYKAQINLHNEVQIDIAFELVKE